MFPLGPEVLSAYILNIEIASTMQVNNTTVDEKTQSTVVEKKKFLEREKLKIKGLGKRLKSALTINTKNKKSVSGNIDIPSKEPPPGWNDFSPIEHMNCAGYTGDDLEFPVSWSAGGSTLEDRWFSTKVNSRSKNQRVKYAIFTPPGYTTHENKTWPVLFYLHGLHIDHNFSNLIKKGVLPSLLRKGEILSGMPFIIIAPLLMRRTTWDMPAVCFAIHELRDHILDTEKVDRNAVFISGFDKLGGKGAWQVVVREETNKKEKTKQDENTTIQNSSKWTAAIVLGGEGNCCWAEKAKNVPFWFLEIDHTVECKKSLLLAESLRKLGNENVVHTQSTLRERHPTSPRKTDISTSKRASNRNWGKNVYSAPELWLWLLYMAKVKSELSFRQSSLLPPWPVYRIPNPNLKELNESLLTKPLAISAASNVESESKDSSLNATPETITMSSLVGSSNSNVRSEDNLANTPPEPVLMSPLARASKKIVEYEENHGLDELDIDFTSSNHTTTTKKILVVAAIGVFTGALYFAYLQRMRRFR